MDLIGNVEGKDVIILDDLVDTAGTLCTAANELKEHGANKIYAFCTHGLFNEPAFDWIKNSAIDKIIVTDTVPLSDSVKKRNEDDLIVQETVGVLLAESIRRIHLDESISDIFELKPKPSKRVKVS